MSNNQSLSEKVTHMNTLHIQQLSESRDVWNTVDIQDTGATTCPEVDLDSRDVGTGTFRLELVDASGAVLDTSELVDL